MKDTPVIQPSVLKFLESIKVNNDRDWFNTHKDWYKEQYESFKSFAHTIQKEMDFLDAIEDLKVYRIYRDVRFAKDKRPYNNHFSASMSRATKWRRGGYYLRIDPENSMVGGGFWGPNPADLKRIRTEIASDSTTFRQLIGTPEFIQLFGHLQGEQVKSAPQGFNKEHKDIDLLRFKQFLLIRKFSDKEVMAPGFFKEVIRTFRGMRPFFDYMSEVLTTDENGVPLET